MPRSFLVKKHFSASKKPNYSELESQTVIVSPQLYDQSYPMLAIPAPEVLSPAICYPPLVWDSGLLSSFFTPMPATAPGPPEEPKALDLTSLSSDDYDSGKGSDPPSPVSPEEEAEKFPCGQCPESYTTLPSPSKHQQLPHSEDTQPRKSFICKVCEKEYVSLGALKMHIRSHTLPCVCKICGKAFSRPWLLQGHIRTHTGEKPFSCTHCSRAFADRSNLRAHLQTHSDVKKYQCKSCSRTFSRMSLLHKHEETGCSGSR
ncbi:zinc finger protein SNAI1 [Macrotis lagotis]|uniref:zinc finger protein SNAI1 n=1 Tax=Macrotis lagotis TaxID=92651 RepID=UPI003D69B866